jgi:hypothetical protein
VMQAGGAPYPTYSTRLWSLRVRELLEHIAPRLRTWSRLVDVVDVGAALATNR